MRDLKDEILSLSYGRATKRRVGSRSTPHRLTQAERLRFELALKLGYLELKSKDRENLSNVFSEYKSAEGYEPIILKEFIDFPSEISKIRKRIDEINPINYSETRNYLNGSVTKLSPYITHGVISLKFIWEYIKNKFPEVEIENQLFKELAWREYFLRVRENLGDKILDNINSEYSGVYLQYIPEAILNYKTEIKVIDSEIRKLITQGYIHNHSRMWIASIVANIAKSDWRLGAKWMYYHLLDGEISSNYLSWQWVAGTFGNKKYYANQDNINRFSGTTQSDTFLDVSYEELPLPNVPEVLKARGAFEFKNQVRQLKSDSYNRDSKTLLYSFWNLDPNWWSNSSDTFQRILLLEPKHFDKFPVSGNVLSFVLKLAQEIKGIKIVVKDFEKLEISKEFLIAKENINTSHWQVGTLEKQEYLFPNVSGYFKSFFQYWKECLSQDH